MIFLHDWPLRLGFRPSLVLRVKLTRFLIVRIDDQNPGTAVVGGEDLKKLHSDHSQQLRDKCEVDIFYMFL